MTDSILLDEHVSRIFERVLRERGYDVVQARARFGEGTVDRELLDWAGRNGNILLTNNARDFEPLHPEIDHSGLFLYREQRLPDREPEALARVVDEILEQYGASELSNEIVDLGQWYDWLHG